MHEIFEETTGSLNSETSRWWALVLKRFFPIYSTEMVELVGRKRHELMFDRQRGSFILSRVRLMASLFAVLTPLWIPLDILAFPRDIWVKLAVSRILVGLIFWALTAYCRRTSTLKQAYLALGVLFFVPSVFFLFSNWVLWGLPLGHVSATMASAYAFLIFLMVAGLGIFPLTLIELAMLALPLLMVAAIPVVERRLYMVPFFNALAVLWLLFLVAGVGCLASVSQFQLLRKLFHKAVVDPLTGALNRESGIALITMHLALAQRNLYPLSLVFVDMDNFKQINDSQGHEAGDKALVRITQLWHASLRDSDVVVRWGGDEFVVLLPHTNRTQASYVMGEDIHRRGNTGELPTFSLGIAEWSEDRIDTWQALVALADQRMYQAKATNDNATFVEGLA